MKADTIRVRNSILTAAFDDVPPGDGGGYLAYTQELPGAISEGDTLEEARANLADAVDILLDTQSR